MGKERGVVKKTKRKILVSKGNKREGDRVHRQGATRSEPSFSGEKISFNVNPKREDLVHHQSKGERVHKGGGKKVLLLTTVKGRATKEKKKGAAKLFLGPRPRKKYSVHRGQAEPSQEHITRLSKRSLKKTCSKGESRTRKKPASFQGEASKEGGADLEPRIKK